MEEEILKEVLPHIQSTEALVQFANYYQVLHLPSVQQRLIELQTEASVQGIDPMASPSRKRASSPLPGPSRKKPHLDSNLSLDNLTQDSLFQGEGEIDYGLYLSSPVRPNEMDVYLNDQEGTDSSNPQQKPYSFQLRKERTFAKHAAVEKIYQIRFNDQWRGQNLRDLYNRLHDMFDHVLREARGQLQGNDLGRVVLHHAKLENPIVVPLRPLDELNANVILSHVENVMKSHNTLALDDSFDVDIGLIDMPKGGTKHNIINVDESVKLKKSIVEIKNTDQLCLARALSVCFAKAHQVSEAEWQTLEAAHPFYQCQCWLSPGSTPNQKNTHKAHLALEHKKCSPSLYINLRRQNTYKAKKTDTKTLQTIMAEVLCEKAGVSQERMASLVDLPKFEAVLGSQILVVSAELGNKLITKGIKDDRKQLFVYLVDNHHFHAIPKLSGFFSRNHFCEHCLTPFQNKEKHECAHYCRVCKRKSCQTKGTARTCPDCHMQCRSEECFVAHKQSKKSKKGDLPSQCKTYWRCPSCFKVLNIWQNKEGQHDCNQYKCHLCQKMVPLDHHCYLAPKPMDEDNPQGKKFILFDFECSQDEISSCPEGYVPSPCSQCGPGEDCSHHTPCENCHQTWCGRQEHKPNFVIAQSVCDFCQKEPLTPGAKCNNCGSRCNVCNKWHKKFQCFKMPPCAQTCGYREVLFKGPNTASQFCAWLFTKAHKHFSVFAHNLKGYDGYFLLDYLIKNSIVPDKVIYNGSKLMYMHVPRGLNIRLLDSLSYFNTKLANLPKMFHLEELHKGYFPHYFNTQGNQNYVGPYPDPSYYGVDSMSTQGRIDFLKWHAEQNHKVFDFAQEMEAYCRSDVQILREALMTFRELLLSVTTTHYTVEDPQTQERIQKKEPGIDPTDYVTIASVCHGVFKHKFLTGYSHVKLLWQGQVTPWLPFKEEKGQAWVQMPSGKWMTLSDVQKAGGVIQERETLPSPIAKVPGDGYAKDQYSKVSIQWMEWLIHSQGHHIQHALNDGEYQIPGTKYKVDGFCAATRTVYQFDGCLYHGCPTCFPHDRDKTVLPHTKQSVSELHALTMKRNAVIKQKGYKLVTLWEHEFRQQVQSNPALKTFVSTLDLQERLSPRDSFFGGRTNASKLYYDAQPNEEMHYYDFTSLYPWVNKYGEYPIGHPQIITKEFKSLEQYFGIAKVKIHPPHGLYHPVLPYRSNNKLKFSLCRTCADLEQQMPCQHTVEERCFIGTWCIPEILKALEKGYELIKIYEVYHWAETTQYDKTTKSGGLFATYINTFLKIKQESSGWPAWCQSESDKQKYVSDYLENEGIQLDYEKIEKNPGLRALSKLLLNSFWGKFAQRANMNQTKFVYASQLNEFYQFLTDPHKIIHDFHILNDKVAQFQWTHKTEFIPDSETTNIFIATFTTCWARLKLYSVLDMLRERVLYYDTDSVIFVSGQGDVNPPLGDYLGELTSELDNDDSIQTFVSGGPKNYAYRTKSGKETCKVRGFTLNYTNSQLINFDSVKNMVLRPQQDGIIDIVNPSKICRDKYSAKIYNRKEKKSYQLVYTKRAIQQNLDTLPFGY